MNSQEIKEYSKAYYQAHKEEMKAKTKAWYQENKQEHLKRCKAYKEAHKDEVKAKKKAWYEANKDQVKAYQKEYYKTEVNSLGQTKHSIRKKSQRILKQMHLHIPGYQIHHCFTYDDASKFIYISKALHRKIHQFLRDNNIDADTDHWMQIRDLVNSTDEFMYIKC